MYKKKNKWNWIKSEDEGLMRLEGKKKWKFNIDLKWN